MIGCRRTAARRAAGRGPSSDGEDATRPRHGLRCERPGGLACGRRARTVVASAATQALRTRNGPPHGDRCVDRREPRNRCDRTRHDRDDVDGRCRGRGRSRCPGPPLARRRPFRRPDPGDERVRRSHRRRGRGVPRGRRRPRGQGGREGPTPRPEDDRPQHPDRPQVGHRRRGRRGGLPACHDRGRRRRARRRRRGGRQGAQPPSPGRGREGARRGHHARHLRDPRARLGDGCRRRRAEDAGGRASSRRSRSTRRRPGRSRRPRPRWRRRPHPRSQPEFAAEQDPFGERPAPDIGKQGRRRPGTWQRST